MKPINYAHLAKKYVAGAKFVVHDRTYEGLSWKGPGLKPSRELFESYAEEEKRQARAEEHRESLNLGLMEERQHQARISALEAIRPFEEKVREKEQIERERIQALHQEAIETRERLKTRDDLLDSWEEITLAQHLINEEAREILKNTDWMITRQQENGMEVPEEVLKDRASARARIQRGEIVFAYWQKLRSIEMPSQREIQEAILKGGEALKQMQEVCRSVALKYPKPRIR